MVILDPTYYEKIARDRAEDDMICVVRITRPAGLEFDVGDVTVTPLPHTLVYDGRARLSNTTGPMNFGFADEKQEWQNLNCWIPWDAPVVLVHDIVTVVTSPDPTLDGRTYQVTDVDRGGQYRAAKMLQMQGTQPAHEELV